MLKYCEQACEHACECAYQYVMKWECWAFFSKNSSCFQSQPPYKNQPNCQTNKPTNQPKKNNKQSNASLYNHPFPLLLFDFAYCRCYNMWYILTKKVLHHCDIHLGSSSIISCYTEWYCFKFSSYWWQSWWISDFSIKAWIQLQTLLVFLC